jgi:hypothetical protein
MATTVPFFYDDQIRRFLIQFTRMFSNYQVEYGRDDSGAATLVRVPVRYGDASRQAATIIADNSRNKMPNAPMMSFHITALDYARDRVQDPYFVDKKSLKQRTWDEDTQTYEQTQGNAFTVERLMPVPYNMTIQLDIWASNTQMKLQILEQILPLFNPSMEIQSTDNYIDWTSLSVVELTGTNWSSRTIPVGTDDNIDVATLTFSIPIWLTMPAKVKKLGVVHKIIASIYDTDGNAADAIVDDDILMGTRQKITPFGYQVLLIGNQLQLLQHEQVDPADGTLNESDLIDTSNPLVWSGYIDTFGDLRDGISQIRLASPNVDTEIVGTVAKHPTDDRILLFSVDADTIPSNTLSPVNAVIDPLVSGPGEGLPTAASGQRYLLTDAIGDSTNATPATAWGNLVANENDIIEYDGGIWNVVWDSSNQTPDQSSDITDYVTNLTTSVQYKWTGTMWVKSYQGIYKGGEWSLVL